MRSGAIACLWLMTAMAGLFLITQPISVEAQLIVAGAAIAVAGSIYVLRLQGLWRYVFLAIATAIVLRYAYWRTTATLPAPDDLLNFVPAMTLYLAEMYYIVLLGMNLFVVSDPLTRPRAPQLSDADLPTVDVFVPSYNEASDILALTLSSAKAMDYPAHKLNVFLLDDGGTDEKRLSRDPRVSASAMRRHEQLQQLCTDLGVGYITRVANTHAKAGNLNAGLQKTFGDLVVVFDADHAPTQEFLRETVGFFHADPRLFLVQTPHFFSNPDPIEKNLQTFEHMPSENEMFYGAIQKGMDKWNASFFCGSAAVLRRAALEQVGGFSGVTITEDCETALELHSRGWNSVYVEKPMITGLQPETLTSFIGQRSRWCRGMIQILLLKNAAFMPGLTMAQKICYLSSSFSWFFPFMRLIFVAAPLLFIIFDMKIYDVSTDEFIAYTLTYLVISSLIRNYLYGRVRWPWMSELYEYVQSVYLFRAIISVLVNPRRPTFNVTAKGETMEEERLSELAWPYFAIFGVLLASMVYAVYRYQTEPEISGILVAVGAWNLVNLLIAGAALGVVTERRERRLSPRLVSTRHSELVVGDQTIAIAIEDISLGGLKAVPLSPLPDLRGKLVAELKVTSGEGGAVLGMLPVAIKSVAGSDEGISIGLRFDAGIRDYPLIAELMLADMGAVRGKRETRQRRLGLVAANLRFLMWGLRYPLRALHHLVFWRGTSKAPSLAASSLVPLPAGASAEISSTNT